MSTATYEALSASEHSSHLRKAVIASTIGTTIEWYDFFIYGTAAGLVFGKLFFPNEAPLTATLAAFGTYFIGFIGRPIGAAIFGHYGDRIGRKATLIATLLCMGIATFLIAFVPTYQSIGIWGGGHLDRSAHDPGHRRWRRMGWLGAAGDGMGASSWPARPGGVVAAIRGSGRALSLEPCDIGVQRLVGRSVRDLGLADSIRTLSIILVGVGLWIRLGILETPVFRQLLSNDRIEKAPILEVFKKQPKEIILSALLRMAEQAPFYIFTAFIFAYAVGTLHMSRNLILSAVLVAACVSFVSIPLSGHISDRIGRKKMYLIGAATVGWFGFLFFAMVDTAVPWAVFIAIVLSLIPHDMQYGPQAALIAEAFTPRLRYSGSSLGYQLASIIAGGPAPLIATALFARFQTGYAISVYIAFCAAVSLASAAFMPDYTGKDISMEYDD